MSGVSRAPARVRFEADFCVVILRRDSMNKGRRTDGAADIATLKAEGFVLAGYAHRDVAHAETLFAFSKDAGAQTILGSTWTLCAISKSIWCVVIGGTGPLALNTLGGPLLGHADGPFGYITGIDELNRVAPVARRQDLALAGQPHRPIGEAVGVIAPPTIRLRRMIVVPASPYCVRASVSLRAFRGPRAMGWCSATRLSRPWHSCPCRPRAGRSRRRACHWRHRPRWSR